MGFVDDIQNSINKLNGAALGEQFDTYGAGAGSKNTEGDFRPGDVNVKTLFLLNEDQTRQHDLLHHATSIQIYESILTPVIFAEIAIQDNIELMQQFPILGEEYIKLSFSTPSSKNNAEYILRVNQVMNKKVQPNNKLVTYVLQCASPELILNATRFVSKSVDDNISNVIKDIVSSNDGLNSKKPLTADTTSGIEKILITRKPPFVAIDFLKGRAVSTEYESSSFVFFENRNGYHFTTVEKMIADGQKKAGDSGLTDKQFYFDTNRNENYNNSTYRNILAYNQISFGDTVSRAERGGITNIVNQFDLITGGLTKINYTNNIGADKFKKADENGAAVNTSTFNRVHGATTTATSLVPVSSDRPDTGRAERISKTMAYVETLTQNIVQVQIYGDSDLTVGDMINCTFPSGTTVDNDKTISRLDSGNYLISKLSHIILLGDRPQHTISMELLKGSLTESA